MCQKLPARNNATIVIKRATIVSAENQNGSTIVKATFFFSHYYIVWESNNAGEARGQSWSKSLKSRWIPGGACGYTSGTKRKHFAALSSPRPCWRWLQLQPSCGSPQCSPLMEQEPHWLLFTRVCHDTSTSICETWLECSLGKYLWHIWSWISQLIKYAFNWPKSDFDIFLNSNGNFSNLTQSHLSLAPIISQVRGEIYLFIEAS